MVSAIYGNFYLWDAEVHDNNGPFGAFYISGTGSSITICGGRFYNNGKRNSSSFINCLAGCNTTIWDCEAYGNEGSVGPVYLTNGTCNIYGGNFYSNKATNGGAVHVGNGICNIYGGNFTYNTATSNGGAVYIGAGTFNMYGGSFTNNTSTVGNGGAVYVNSGSFNMYGGSFESNSSPSSNSTSVGIGGAAYINGGNFTMTGGSFVGNTSRIYPGFYCNKSVYLGGAITIKDNTTVAGVEQNLYLANESAIVTIVQPLDDAYVSITKTIPAAGQTVVAQGASQATGGLIQTDAASGFKKYTNNGTGAQLLYDPATASWYYSVAEGVIYKNAAGDEIYQRDGNWYVCGTSNPATLAETDGVVETPTKKAFNVGATATAAYVTPMYQAYTHCAVIRTRATDICLRSTTI